MIIDYGKIFLALTRKQLAILVVGSVVYGALFVNYIEYRIFSMALMNAQVPELYHGWLEVLYIIPFLSIVLFRGPYALVLVYILGRIASLANDFAYPLLAKYIYGGYDGNVLDWWIWIFGFGHDDRFSWMVKMPFVTYQMTSIIMGINLAVRILLITAFFIGVYFYQKRLDIRRL